MPTKKESAELTDADRYQIGVDAIAQLVAIGVPHASIFPVQRVVEDFGARAANKRSVDGTDGETDSTN